MVEYETLGLVALITGLFSYQIKFTYDKLKEKLDEETLNAKEIHKELCNKINEVKNNCRCKCI